MRAATNGSNNIKRGHQLHLFVTLYIYYIYMSVRVRVRFTPHHQFEFHKPTIARTLQICCGPACTYRPHFITHTHTAPCGWLGKVMTFLVRGWGGRVFTPDAYARVKIKTPAPGTAIKRWKMRSQSSAPELLLLPTRVQSIRIIRGMLVALKWRCILYAILFSYTQNIVLCKGVVHSTK